MRIPLIVLLVGSVLTGLTPSAWAACGLKDFVPFKVEKGSGGSKKGSGDPVLFTTSAVSSSSTYGFAQSSGTSGCGSKGQAALDAQAEFVATAHEQLSEDIAQGGGEHLTALAALMDCAPAVRPHLNAWLQERLGGTLPGSLEQAEALLWAIRGEVAADTELRVCCPAGV